MKTWSTLSESSEGLSCFSDIEVEVLWLNGITAKVREQSIICRQTNTELIRGPVGSLVML
jgi:hypothetical protein